MGLDALAEDTKREVMNALDILIGEMETLTQKPATRNPFK